MMDTQNIVGDVFLILTQILLFSMGSYIQLKIISISKDKRANTWQMDITHSVALMIFFSFGLIFEPIIDAVPTLSQYTGVIPCYIAAFIYLYGTYIIGFHSLVISFMKYVLIVHCLKVRNYGEEKVKLLFFWINLIHPFLLTIPTIWLFDFESYSSVTTCLGLRDQLLERYNKSNGNIERMFMCKLANGVRDEIDAPFSYAITQGFCAVKMVWILLLSCNIAEGYFYFQIFRKMSR